MNKGKVLNSCLACGGPKLTQVLDFGNQPLANSYKKNKSDPEDEFPLGLNRCLDCHHLQLPYAVNPELMFKNYVYVSGTSQTLRDYFEWFASFAIEYSYRHTSQMSTFAPAFPTTLACPPMVNQFETFTLNAQKTVLDVACNDGTQLDSFRRRGCLTWGIDPAENLYQSSAIDKKHNVYVEYMNNAVVDRIKMAGLQRFDIINAQNVFAHNSDPLGFLYACQSLMDTKSLLFIQNSQADMIKNGEFDTIYHEHHSFWNYSSMSAVASKAGLEIIDRIRVPVHGTSDIFVLAKMGYHSRTAWGINARAMEAKEGLYDPKTYDEYAKRVKQTLKSFGEYINDYGIAPWQIIGYGAAAKGNTLLNAAKVKLDIIVDDNPLKQGTFTPGMSIPIIAPEEVSKYNDKDILWVPLAWNFFDEIKSKVIKLRANKAPTAEDCFLSYFPDIKITS
jgi:2-polyprenyl-3-methyl-5-hydroxy-6-metoxy-1,4-benzoquinol methylase